MRYIIGILFMALLIGCSKPVEKEYIQEKYANVTPSESTINFERCKYGNLTYYHDGILIFQSDKDGNLRILSPIGDYSKPKDYPRWQLRQYRDVNDSIYNQTWEYILSGKQPNGENVTCSPDKTVPTPFVNFVASHAKLFRDFDKVKE